MSNIIKHQRLLLSAQRALLEKIYPSIRAIAIGELKENKLKIICYLDRIATEMDYENLSDIAAEICADINFINSNEECIYTLEPLSQINNVLFGNPFATELELKEVSDLNKEEITLNIKLEKNVSKSELEIIDYKKHFRRGDITENYIRSTMTRILFKKEDIEPNNKNNVFSKGDVVIINNNGKNYKGELHIILKNNFTDTDNMYNLVGKIDNSEIKLLDYIEP